MDLGLEAVQHHSAVQKILELQLLLRWLPTGISRVLEIGSKDGGTLWLWRQLAPNVTSIDIAPVPRDLDVTYIQADSHLFRDEKIYDLVFIDGDHSYEGARADFDYWGAKAPIVVMHDIVPGDDGREVDRLWNEIKRVHMTREWIDPQTRWLPSGEILSEKDGGIGVVVRAC